MRNMTKRVFGIVAVLMAVTFTMTGLAAEEALASYQAYEKVLPNPAGRNQTEQTQWIKSTPNDTNKTITVDIIDSVTKLEVFYDSQTAPTLIFKDAHGRSTYSSTSEKVEDGSMLFEVRHDYRVKEFANVKYDIIYIKPVNYTGTWQMTVQVPGDLQLLVIVKSRPDSRWQDVASDWKTRPEEVIMWMDNTGAGSYINRISSIIAEEAEPENNTITMTDPDPVPEPDFTLLYIIGILLVIGAVVGIILFVRKRNERMYQDKRDASIRNANERVRAKKKRENESIEKYFDSDDEDYSDDEIDESTLVAQGRRRVHSDDENESRDEEEKMSDEEEREMPVPSPTPAPSMTSPTPSTMQPSTQQVPGQIKNVSGAEQGQQAVSAGAMPRQGGSISMPSQMIQQIGNMQFTTGQQRAPMMGAQQPMAGYPMGQMPGQPLQGASYGGVNPQMESQMPSQGWYGQMMNMPPQQMPQQITRMPQGSYQQQPGITPGQPQMPVMPQNNGNLQNPVTPHGQAPGIDVGHMNRLNQQSNTPTWM